MNEVQEIKWGECGVCDSEEKGDLQKDCNPCRIVLGILEELPVTFRSSKDYN